MAKLLYQGHSSIRVVSSKGTVMYLDPFCGEGYDLPADLLLVTHEHSDHNRTELVTMKKDGVTLRSATMLVNGEYQTKEAKDFRVEAVPASNANHDIRSCVGYVVEVDGKKIYFSGDTSYLPYFEENLSKRGLDYAFLPCDGVFNMGPEEAARCADIIGAKHSVPIHTQVGFLYNPSIALRFKAKNTLYLVPGQEVEL